MIYTFTLNPAVDYFISVTGDLVQDEVNRGKNEVYRPGGKGLNVSSMLSHFGIPSVSVVLLGGFTGNYIFEEYSADGLIRLLRIPVEGSNRINIKINRGDHYLCLNGEGPVADENAKIRLNEIVSQIRRGDTAVFSGSMMRGFSDDDLVSYTEVLHKNGVYVVLDMEKISKELLGRCRPDLIKPNLHELRLLLEDPCLTSKDAFSAVDSLLEYSGEVLLSLGKDGAVLAGRSGKLCLMHPEITAANQVGAGDAMLAAYIGKRSCGSDRAEALKWAGAAGSAVARGNSGVSLPLISTFFSQMKIVFR